MSVIQPSQPPQRRSRWTRSHANGSYPNYSQQALNNQTAQPGLIATEKTLETVKLRLLPFYDKVVDIRKADGLFSEGIQGRANSSLINFQLTLQQADMIAMSFTDLRIYSTQILLRFCYLEENSEQDDNFPHDAVLTINNEMVQLPPAISNPNKPQIPPKRPGKPLDITNFCKLSPFTKNTISIKWHADPLSPTRAYLSNISICKRLDSHILLERVKAKGRLDKDITKQIIIEKLISDPDGDIATETLQASLICPLGKMRMRIPCKSSKCIHIPCFDALFYLQMNEKKPTWTCPVCYQQALYQDLIIDGMFFDIIEQTDSNSTEIQFNKDGSWSPTIKRDDSKLDTSGHPPNKKPPIPIIEVVTISDSSDEESQANA